MTRYLNSRLNKKIQKQIAKSTGIAVLITMAVFSMNYLLKFAADAAPGRGLTATYYDNADLTGSKIVRVDDVVDFKWQSNSPGYGMDAETYSVVWQGQLKPRFTDTYSFHTFSDDGVRLWVDGQLIIDNWTLHPGTENVGTIALEADKKYSIKLEYFENTGNSVIQLSWSSPQQPKEIIPQSQLYPIVFAAETRTEEAPIVMSDNQNSSLGLKAEYFSGKDFGNLKLTRTDSTVNFDWRASSPDPKIPTNNFTARWTGQIEPEFSENYTFYTISDDGVRLWINNLLVINNWSDHPVTENKGIVALEAGKKYDIKLEYYENWGESAIVLAWESESQRKEVIPQSALSNTVVYTAAAKTEIPVAEKTQEPVQTNPAPAPVPTINTLRLSSDSRLFVNNYSQAKQWADNNKNSRPHDAQMVEKIASQATATWLGGWNGNIYEDVKRVVTQATLQNQIPVFVAYNIPQRDCGGYSAGGTSYENYRSWIGSIASAIASDKALVVLEPDALASMECLSESDKENRMNLLKDAVNILKANGSTSVYIDAGHAKWISPDTISERLKKAGIDKADGFALNTSNFISTSENTVYGEQVSAKTGGKHFVIDTSRNGTNANDSEWCNPHGRSLGNPPTLNTGNPLIDGYLWIKAPGESDGNCNGGPSAGQFWPEYAVGLAQRASW